MFCKNCGNQMDEIAVVCVKCGTQKGMGVNFCANCGKPINPGATFCTSCGAAANFAGSAPIAGRKSRIAAGLLGIFLGWLGVHNFYLGFNKIALIQLLVGTIGGIITCGVATAAMGIWGLVEGIMILCKNRNVDANGQPLVD